MNNDSPNPPTYEQLLKEREQMLLDLEFFMNRNLTSYQSLFPPGHFYSPVPSIEEVQQNEERLFSPPPPELPGIRLDLEEQLAYFQKLVPYYQQVPFPETAQAPWRYYFRNGMYAYTDGTLLSCMLAHHRPKRVIEVGSGFSSALMLDMNDHLLQGSMSCLFIEPYPDRLMSLIHPSDRLRVQLYPQKVQDVDIHVFQSLTENDLLFIDSSHVSKIGSDVNHLFFNILPALQKGVLIHIHDIFYPFEYPQDWIYSGMHWNEAYLLRAFLQYNPNFIIEFFPDYLLQFHPETVYEAMPLCRQSPAQSIWLRKVN